MSVVNGTSLQGNSSEMGWTVQKFGGTSVGKFATKIAEDVVGSLTHPFYYNVG